MKTGAGNDWAGLPGAGLIEQGLADLRAGRMTEPALLVAIGEPRLRALGIAFPQARPAVKFPPEHALYDLLAETSGADAHSRYNALLRRMNSFAHALEREQSAR